MKSYYQGRHARNYNSVWKTFSERTLHATLTSIEEVFAQQQEVRPSRILDVGCGTGLLLSQLADHFPDAHMTGLDSSPDMLEQAARALKGRPHIHLIQAEGGTNRLVRLPFAPSSFDLITCTNTLHYFPDMLMVLQTWREVLGQGGHVVIEDYLLRHTPLPWNALERAIKLYDPQHVRLYWPITVQSMSQCAEFQVLDMRYFPIDLFCQGWVIHLRR